MADATRVPAMIAGVYARKSTQQERASEDARSVGIQLERARAYAARKGWVVAEEHTSGTTFDEYRPELFRLLTDLKNTPRPPFQVLIVSELSRLGRDSVRTPLTVQQIEETGVAIWSYQADTRISLDDEASEISTIFNSLAASFEKRRSRQRTRAAHQVRAERGLVTGGRVFGYRNAATPDGFRTRVIDPAEAKVVKQMFECAAKGWGLRRIAFTLNAEKALAPLPYAYKAKPARPRAWATSSVREVLHRPIYAGRVVWGRHRNVPTAKGRKVRVNPTAEWITVERPELRIVPADLWDAVQRRLQATRETYLRTTGGRLFGKPTNPGEGKHLLSGLATCAACGGSLYVRLHGAKRGPTYHCTFNATRGRTVCRNDSAMPAEWAHRAVLATVERDVLREDVIADALAGAVKRIAEKDGHRGDHRARLERELRGVQEKIERLTDAIEAGQPVGTRLREREADRAHSAGAGGPRRREGNPDA